MITIMAEFSGRRKGYFRPKPVCKVGRECTRCGSTSHVGTTTCDVKVLPKTNTSMPGNAAETEVKTRCILARNPRGKEPGMHRVRGKTDEDRYAAAMHAATCQEDNCEYCDMLCDEGMVICCDGCGNVHHTDWRGWRGVIGPTGGCTVLCPECACWCVKRGGPHISHPDGKRFTCEICRGSGSHRAPMAD